jgi:hypothetical protein
MDVGAVGAIGEREPFIDFALRARGRARRAGGSGKEPQRGRRR